MEGNKEMRPSARTRAAGTRPEAAPPEGAPPEILFKPVAAIRLKVLRSGKVRVTAPPDTPESYILRLLREKRPWIERHLRLFRETRPVEREDEIRTGTATRILGRQLYVVVKADPRPSIVREDRRLVLRTPLPEDCNAVGRQFRRWWRRSARACFLETLDRLYPVVGRRGVARPSLRVLPMKTLWGSCGRSAGRITLNTFLYKAPQSCIDYVVLHELLHFLHPRHDKAFLTALTALMPDWPSRKRFLDHETVLGF